MVTDAATDQFEGKWLAFAAIGLAFVTNVLAMSMVFVALPSIADDFGVTLRSVAWVVIAQSLTISSLMLPMGRVADIVGRRRLHLLGLVLFGVGSVAVAAAPTFGLLIAARVLMAVGNAMGQSVGTAMVVAVFPPGERGKAIGSQTTAVAIGAASGPIVGGLILQVLPWEAMFLLLLVPIAAAFVAGSIILSEERVSPQADRRVVGFDWGGAVLSAVMVVCLVLTINNPLALDWTSPVILGGIVVVVALFGAWVRWEQRTPDPMLEMSLFRNRAFSAAVGARLVGFMGATAVFFLAPVFLISLRSMSAAATGGVLFLNSLGMGVAAQASGRLSDRFGAQRFSVAGFGLFTVSAFGWSAIDRSTPVALILPLMLVTGLSVGLWNVPNNSTIMGSVPANRHGVVGAFTNLVRNMGNVTGQAVASAVIVGIMTSKGFDIPLSDIADSTPAGDAFLSGWRWTFRIAVGLSMVGMFMAATGSQPRPERQPVAARASTGR